MKKIYSLFLLLVLLLCTGNKASALSTTIEWDIPGSVTLKLDNRANPDVALSPDQTSYVFSTTETYGYVYVFAADGYTLIDAATTDGSNKYSVSTYFTPHFISIYIGEGNGMDGKTVKVNCIKTERNETFNIDVVNGVDYLSAEFASNYKLDLKQGNNSYKFNKQIDGNLTVSLVGISSAYSITLDGKAVNKNYNASYTLAVNPGSNVVIQPFESEDQMPKDCKFTLKYGPNMEGCLYSLYNTTTGKMYQPNELVNNSVVLKTGNEVKVNLVSGDYTYTKFLLDGVDITNKHITNSFGANYISFTLPNAETSTLEIQGTAKVYPDIEFTGYILGAEGVDFSLTYQGTPIEIPEGVALTENITIGSYTLTPENAKKYIIPVSEKIGKIFFSPKDGYYIADLYTSTSASGTKEQHSGSSSIFPNSDGKYFYMVVKKLEAKYTFDITTTGSTYTGRLGSANQAIIDSWGNPDGLKGMLSTGTKSVAFVPGYDVPGLISVSGSDTMNPAVYLDGAEITGVTNTNSGAKEFTFTPYSPTDGDGIADGVKSDVRVYLSTERPIMSGASLVVEDGAQAQFFYSPVRREANPAGQAVISGTKMIVKPASNDMTVTYKDEKVTLDENGEFVFEATGNARVNIVTVSLPSKYADMLVKPADGATVKSLSKISITLPCIDPNYESMLDYNETILPQLKVKKGSEVVAEFGELGEPSEDGEGNTVVPIILSSAITAAGTYTIEIPEGAFVEKAWSEADQAMMPVLGGFKTPAYNGTVTVNPDMISICDDITLSPESGATVEEISSVKVTFNQLSAEAYFSGWEFQNATFTNGETTVYAIVTYDWMNETENRVMTVTPIDDSEEPAPITAAGTWTMTIAAGTFSYNDETNGTITATYTIEGDPAYVLTPASGSTVDNLAAIKIEFPDVTTIEYTDAPITLTGSNYSAASTDVHGIGNSRSVSFRNPTADGEYTVTFPAGAFSLDGKESKEITAVYNFQSSYLLNPASGSTISTFDVAISFPHATNVEFVGGASSIILTNNHSYASPSINCVKDATASVPTFKMTIPEGAQVPPTGNYNLIIDEGAFQIDNEPSVAIFADYTIEHEVSTDYTLTPDGTIVYQEWGYDFALIFDELATLTRPDASKIEVTFDGVAMPATSYQVSVEMNMLLFFVSDTQYCKDGVIKVNIAAGAFNIGSKPNPAIEAQWTLVAPKSFTATVTPAANDADHKIAEIETVYINYPDAKSGEIFNEYGASLRSSDYNYFETGTIQKDETAANNGVTFAITFKKTTEAGTYLLTVRDDTFVLDGVFSSSEISATYYVDPATSGIEGIIADENGNVTVYTIDGRLILDNAPAADVRNIQKGLYIINGKKVVLK